MASNGGGLGFFGVVGAIDNSLQVGDIVLVDLIEQIHGDQALDYVVRGEAQVVNAVLLLKLYQHFFVVGKGGVVYADTGLLGELAEKLFVNIVAPVEYVKGDGVRAGAAACEAADKHGKNQYYSDFFHVCVSFVCEVYHQNMVNVL